MTVTPPTFRRFGVGGGAPSRYGLWPRSRRCSSGLTSRTVCSLRSAGRIASRKNVNQYQMSAIDRPLPARQRKWNTKSGKANFIAPPCLSEDPDLPQRRDGVLTLITVRSNDQFNTTVYGYEDRLRGIHGTREVVLM